MPLYDFKCDKCGNTIERFFNIANRPEHIKEKCAQCNKKTQHTFALSSPAIVYGVIRATQKMPTEFKNRMEQIRKNNPNMNSRYI